MNKRSGMSKIALVIIILLVLLIIAGGGFAAWWFLGRSSNVPADKPILEENHTEGQGFENDGLFEIENLKPLASGLEEYRNEELGVRFGYLSNMSLPVDEEIANGQSSTITHKTKSIVIQFRTYEMDKSQTNIDYIKREKDALVEELIKAGTKEVEVEENGKKVTQTVTPTEEEVSDINVSYTVFANQLAVIFEYKENDLKANRILTIKDGMIYSLTYKANEDDFDASSVEKVFNSFEFISKIDDVKKTSLNTVTIDEKEYTLPIKASNIENVSIENRYATQNIEPNYFTVVSLYSHQSPLYSAYIYNPRASVSKIGSGYITTISTDVNRGGNLKIYKGIELGTTYAKVNELLGTPTQDYKSDEGILINIYEIEGVTIRLMFQNNLDSATVIGISLAVSK